MRLRAIVPETIAGQVTGLIVLSVAMAFLLNLVAIFIIASDRDSRPPLLGPFQIITIAQLANASRSEEEIATLVASARHIGIAVNRRQSIPPSDKIMPLARARMPFFDRLEGVPGFEMFQKNTTIGADNTVRIQLQRGGTLIFPMPPELHGGFPGFILFPVLYVLSTIAIICVGLSLYAARSIISPLSAFAAAARAVGRTTDGNQAVPERGPQEIVQVARALNGMRDRIHALLDERTSMLTAISHDLRTPLTRIKLRAERLSLTPAQSAITEGILLDIVQMEQMLTETLSYLRDDAQSEPSLRADLPSMLETICIQPADLGKLIAYDGPKTLVYCCQAGRMMRAINNLVENAVRHGTNVAVTLRSRADGDIQIDVDDDGPGIPYSLHKRVFEPFFKIDSARTSDRTEGFGLGLSIARNVVEAHKGTIELIECVPHGLRVRIVLPAEQ
ncbi:MAG TPA: ATP-binding protein [Rhizomicrobium sp.]|jgi:signal transduction histidine kinase